MFNFRKIFRICYIFFKNTYSIKNKFKLLKGEKNYGNYEYDEKGKKSYCTYNYGRR